MTPIITTLTIIFTMTFPSNIDMSLLSVIINDFTLDPILYQCPQGSDSERERPPPRHILGVYFLVSGGVLMTIYLLCLKAMLSKELIASSSYKIMVCLAIFDLLSLFTNSLVTGYFAYQGLTYCDHQLFIFICGAMGFGCWLGCSISCVTLALCRIAELNPQLPLAFQGWGWPMRLILCLIFLVAAYGTLLTKPVIFHLEFMSWFFDPGVGQDPNLYTNLYHTVNNITMAVLTSALYAILCYSIFRKTNGVSMQISHSQRQFCYQAVVICVVHGVSSSVYVYMQFFYTPEWLIAAEQVGWQMCTGGICLVYLTFNATIRTSILKTISIHKLPLATGVSNAVAHSHSVTAF